MAVCTVAIEVRCVCLGSCVDLSDWLFQFQPRGLNPSSERWQANLGCWRNGGVFSAGVWPLLDNLEDPVLRSRADTCAGIIRSVLIKLSPQRGRRI